MSSLVQLISFFISFLFGIVFYVLARFNKFMIKNKSNMFKFIITLVFVVDMVIIYIYLMYKVNYGDIHPYFIIMVLIGYGVIYLLKEKILRWCKIHVKVKKLYK